MATDWTVKKNFGGGPRFHTKPLDEMTRERITFKTNKKQKAVIVSYCEKNDIQLSDFIRTAISEYFNRIGYDLPADQPEDSNQLKIFPD